MSGTLFYAYYDDMGFGKGFFMSVNVGYSIGWGYPVDPNNQSIVYSIFHLIVGSSAVAAALAFFAQAMLEENKNWYETAIHKAKLQSMADSMQPHLQWEGRFHLMFDGLGPFFIWIMVILLGTAWSCEVVGWSFEEGLYFAISTCSTGGLWALPIDSSDFVYFTGETPDCIVTIHYDVLTHTICDVVSAMYMEILLISHCTVFIVLYIIL